MIKAVFSKSINDLTTENLYQWDSYQTLSISGIDFLAITPKVHFCNKKSTEALAVEGVLQADGSCQVSIPNSLLSEKYDILAYIYTNTGLTYKTIKSITIPIIPRLKPTNYTQPSNEDIIEIEAIELQAKLILEGLYATEYSDSTSYKRPNIVYYNNGAYMCKSNVSISGVLPTDTTKWQLLVQGEYISSMSVNSEGKLVLTTTTGNTYSIDFQTKNVSLADSNDIPALNLTAEDVERVKNPPNPTKLVGTSVLGTSSETKEITKTGLYIVVYMVDYVNYTDIIAIPNLTQDSVANSGKVKYDSASKKIIRTDTTDTTIKSINVAFKLVLVDADGNKFIYNSTSDKTDY